MVTAAGKNAQKLKKLLMMPQFLPITQMVFDLLLGFSPQKNGNNVAAVENRGRFEGNL